MTHNADNLHRIAWHVSSYSNGGGINCVEAGAYTDRTGRVAVRQHPARRRHPGGRPPGLVRLHRSPGGTAMTG